LLKVILMSHLKDLNNLPKNRKIDFLNQKCFIY
jgi:hypothetical protein